MQSYYMKQARHRVISSFVDFYRVVRLRNCINLAISGKSSIFAVKSSMFNPLKFFSLCTTNKPLMPPHSTVPLLLSVTFPISCPSQPGPSSADGSSPIPASNPSLPPDPVLSPPPRSLSSSQSSANRKVCCGPL